jgi:hypothetical protein
MKQKMKQKMKPLFLLFIGLILTANSTSAQTLKWVKQIGAGSHDQGRSIAFDASGNVYTTGTFNGTVDFDPGPGTFSLTSTAVEDVFISKLDSSGNFIWAGKWGGGSFDLGLSIAVDSSGFVYTTGLFQGTADFDPGAGTFNLTSSSMDAYVAKLDALTGNLVWAKQFRTSFLVEPGTIAVDQNGNVITVGHFEGIVDFDPGAGSFNLSGDGAYICKLDSAGNLVWAKQLAHPTSQSPESQCGAKSVILDKAGNVYCTGYFIDTVDFDPGVGNYNLVGEYFGDAFICKLDASGNFKWAKSFYGNGNESGSAIALDASENVYTIGILNATADLDPGVGVFNLSSAGIGNFDGYISKLNAAGDFVWAKQLGGAVGSGLFISSIVLDADSNVVIIGNFSQTVDFDPGSGSYNLSTSGSYDVFISKLDNSLNFVSTIQFAGSGFNDGRSLAIDNKGSIYATGQFKATTDFDPQTAVFNLLSAGSDDIFIIKLQNDLSPTTSISENSWNSKINLYPNPTTGALTIESEKTFEKASVIVRNAIGQEIFSNTYASTNHISLRLDTAPGVYFIEIIDEAKVAILKVIKE